MLHLFTVQPQIVLMCSIYWLYCVNYNNINISNTGHVSHQEVTGASMHVLVHEVQDSKPKSSKGRQRKQWREMLEEHLRRPMTRNQFSISSKNHQPCFPFTVMPYKSPNLSDLGEQCAGPHPGLLHTADICWADVVQELS